MRTRGRTLLLLLLLLACCLWSARAQGDARPNLWDDPVRFKTKAQDSCDMTVTGQGPYTRMKLTCRSRTRGYSCEYVGRPRSCLAYSKNPRHYFVQMMWGLRKLQNACQAPRQIKSHMCRKATDESQMVFVPGSFAWLAPEAPTRPGPRPPLRPARPQPRPAPTRPVAARQVPPQVKPTPKASPKPATPPTESNAKRIARQYCWRSLQGLCSFFIGLVRK